jgi:hypothetical protein
VYRRLARKSKWFVEVIDPAGKVRNPTSFPSEITNHTGPAITYDGPVVSPDQPSPESTKLAGSLVLIEFIADLSPVDHNSAIRAYLGTAAASAPRWFDSMRW